MKIIKILSVCLGVLLVFIVGKNNLTPWGLGVDEGRFKALSQSPNGVSSQAVDEDKYVEAWPFTKDSETSIDKVKKACEAYGHSRLIQEEADYLHFVFKSPMMAYKDDVEFYFDQKNKLVHFRSQSRLGYSDMGLNKERYDALYVLYTSAE